MKKTVSIILAVVLGIIAVTTIVLSLVKINFNSSIDLNFGGVDVYKNGSHLSYYDNESDEAKQIKSYLESGFKENIIASLFQGGLSGKAKAQVVNKTTTSLESDTKNSENVFIKISYNSEQTLKLNGEVYKDEQEKEVKYKEILVKVENSNTLTATNIYFVRYDSTNGSSSSLMSDYYVSTVSHLSGLYGYIADLKAPGYE